MILRFLDSGFEYGILCEDDFSPRDHFIEELGKTVSKLPHYWRALHLCPGWAYGRSDKKHENREKVAAVGRYDPEKHKIAKGVDEKCTILPFSDGRVFSPMSKQTCFELELWVGGPIAVLLRRESALRFLRDIQVIKEFVGVDHADRVMCRIMEYGPDFVCRDPQMGAEVEQGGTTLH